MEHIITVNKYFREIDVKMGIKFIFLKDVKNIDIFNPDNEYIQWLKFIKFDNREVIDMINTMNSNTKLATDELDKINAEEEARNYARMREFDQLDRKLEYSAGVNAGRIEGKVTGKLEAFIEMAKKMLKDNYDISTIKYLTGLSENEILKLKEVA